MTKISQTTKTGFSLVEVMIIFTVLAVVMAAAMPVITKKSSPIPAKISHGVYRCIANPEGNGYTEEYYTGTRLESRNPSVTECTFNVPKSSVYKVDMYSAGSGGTIDGQIIAQNNEDDRSGYYTVGTSVYNTSSSDQLHEYGFDAIRQAFSGATIKMSHYTGNAGKGGQAKLTYVTPIQKFCSWSGASEFAAGLNQMLVNLEQELADLLAPYQEKLELYKEAKGYIDTFDEAIHVDINHNPRTSIADYLNLKSVELLYLDNLASAARKFKDTRTEENYNNFKSLATTTYTSGSYSYSFNLIDGEPTGFAEFPNQHPMPAGKSKMDLVTNSYIETLLADIADFKDGLINRTKGYLNNFIAAYADYKRDMDDFYNNNYALLDLPYPVRDYEIPSDISYNNYNEMFYVILHYQDGGFDDMKAIIQGRITGLENEIETKEEHFKEDHGMQLLQEQIKVFNTQLDEKLKGYIEKKQTNDSSFYNLSSVFNDQVQAQFKDFCTVATYLPDSDWYCESVDTGKIDNKDYVEASASGGTGGKGLYQMISYKIPGFIPSSVPGDTAAIRSRNYLSGLFSSANAWAFYSVVCNKDGIESNTKIYDLGRCKYVNGSIGNGANGTDYSANYEDNKNEVFDTQAHPHGFHVDGNKKYIQGASGQSVADITTQGEGYTYMGWRVPSTRGPLSSNNNAPVSEVNYISLIKQLPTGGTGGKVTITESTQTYSIANSVDYMLRILHDPMTYTNARVDTMLLEILANDYSHKVSKQAGSNGSDVVMESSDTPNSDTGSNTIQITVSKEPNSNNTILTQIPRLYTQSSLWVKKYKLGPAGNQGRTSHTTETNLGAYCKMQVPHGGIAYDQTDNSVHLDVLQNSLAVSMTCYDKDSNPLYTKKLDGPLYNTELIDGDEFHWSKTYSTENGYVRKPFEPGVPEPTAANSKVWRPTSIWTKVYNLMFNSYGQYNLNDYHVGAAGEGTKLVDYCVVPRGKFSASKKYYKTYTIKPSELVEMNDADNSYLSDENISYNGMYQANDGNYNCYGVPVNNTTTTQATRHLKTSENGSVYNISAKDGGGGAIVITW